MKYFKKFLLLVAALVMAIGIFTVSANAAQSYTLKLNANGGKISTGATTYSKKVKKKAKVGTLPSASKTGYTFKGWYTAKSGGTKITASTKYTYSKNMTLYARWTANKYTLTINANGGKYASGKTSASKKVTYAAKVGTLGTPTRTGYTFAGYYTAKTGGTKVAATTVYKYAKNVTLYALWTANK